MSTDISQYKVGEILSIEDCGKCKKGGKSLRACKIRIGGQDNDNYDEEQDIITVVTSATNVRDGSRIAVAPAGSTILDSEGTSITVTQASVGGVLSQGMLCDSRALGWTGGAQGVAVQIPPEVEVGSAPPSSKPRSKGDGGGGGEVVPAVETKGLFEKKLTKAEKKKIAEERRKAKKDAKLASKPMAGGEG